MAVFLKKKKKSGLLTSLTTVHTVLAKVKILQCPHFVKVIFNLLNDTRCAVFAEVVHAVEGLEDSAPLLGLGLDLGPEVLHDNVVVLPVVGVIGKHLQLAVGNVPVLVRGGLVKDGLEFARLENPTSTFLHVGGRVVQ